MFDLERNKIRNFIYIRNGPLYLYYIVKYMVM